MSMAALTWVNGVKAGGSSERAVLRVLADAANEDAQTYIAQKTIADRSELSLRTVVSAMKALEGSSLITRTKRYDKLGKRTSDLISLRLSAAVAPSEGRLSANNVADYVQPLHTIPYLNPKEDIGLSDTEAKTRAKADYPAEFEALWLAYPTGAHRSDKKASLARWRKLSASDRQSLAVAVLAYSASPLALKDGGQFVSRMENWLSKEKWREHVPASILPAKPVAADWDLRLSNFKRSGAWFATWGEPPTQPDCRAPVEALARHGFTVRGLRVIGGGAA